MGFGSKLKKAFGGGKGLLPVIGAVLGSAFLPGIGTALGAGIGTTGGAAIGSGLGTLAGGGSIRDALLSGVGSYAGGTLGSSLYGGTVGSALYGSGAYGPHFFPGIGSSLGAALGNASLGGIAGGFYGSDLAQTLFGKPKKYGEMPTLPAAPNAPAPYRPQREAELDTPPSISGLGALSPIQKSTGVANQGVYGGGASPLEQRYFLNQINRRLVDESGGVQQDFSSLRPIEMSYLQQLGLGGYGNTSNLLEAINRWSPA